MLKVHHHTVLVNRTLGRLDLIRDLLCLDVLSLLILVYMREVKASKFKFHDECVIPHPIWVIFINLIFTALQHAREPTHGREPCVWI